MRRPILLSVLFAVSLSACGTRGSLYLPPPQPKAPAPPASAPSTPPDHSTAKESAS